MTQFEDLEIVYRDPNDLRPDPRNARRHPASQIKKLRSAFRRFGFRNPVLLKDDGETIGAGNGRVEAAIEEGLERIPTITVLGLSEEEWRAFAIADNRIALDADWNMDILRTEMLDLKKAGLSLDLTGFDEKEVLDLFKTPKMMRDADADAGEPPAAPVSRPGDVWLLGDHRLGCGDSTDPKVVEAVLRGTKPHLMVSDPPYGVEYDAEWRNQAERADGRKLNSDPTVKRGLVKNDHKADWREAWALFPGEVAYVWHGGLATAEVLASLQAVGFELRAQIIWRKSRSIIGRGHYHWQHEPCWYVVRKGGKGHWQGSRKESTVWDIDHRKSDTGHGTQKPVEAMRRPIETNSQPGDRVYEPFSGSGTTIIAAQMTKRICLAIELDAAYVDVSILRWMNFTGETATLEETGEPWSAVVQRRKGDG